MVSQAAHLRFAINEYVGFSAPLLSAAFRYVMEHYRLVRASAAHEAVAVSRILPLHPRSRLRILGASPRVPPETEGTRCFKRVIELRG